MADYPNLAVELRSSTGSVKARAMRRMGIAPGVVYGHGDPLMIQMQSKAFREVVPTGQYGSMIVQLQLDGKDAGLALVKNVQVDTLHKIVMNIDLQRVSLLEKLTMTLPLVLVGEPVGIHAGGRLAIEKHTLNVRCIASAVPESITCDITHLQIGEHLTAGELVMPEGCELLDKADESVVGVHALIGAAAGEAGEGEAATEAAAE